MNAKEAKNWLFVLVFLSCCITNLHAPKPYQPNIVFIVVDDLGSNDLGLHGSGIKTPVSDKLAQDGLYLNNFYVMPGCTATRIALMTGRYPYRTGLGYKVIGSKTNTGMALDEETIPQVLRRAGYQTHAVGKWHLGHAKYAHLPTFRGFQSFYGFYVGSKQDHFKHTLDGAYDMRWDKKEFCGKDCSQIVDKRGRYSTHVFTNKAIRAVQRHDASQGPLFLYLAFAAPHAPIQVPPKYRAMYRNKKGWSNERKAYAGMVTAADVGIKKLITALKKKHMWKDTLVVFMSDNGGSLIRGASNKPFREGKRRVWEGGIRVDGIVGGPARKKLRIAGGRLDHLFQVTDWLPTLAAISGASPAGNKLDGINQLKTLRGGKPVRYVLFAGYGAQKDAAVRRGKWKLVRDKDGKYSLYDLSRDRSETKDLSEKRKEEVRYLKNVMRLYEQRFKPAVKKDETCPPRRFGTTSWGEKTWIPWCD